MEFSKVRSTALLMAGMLTGIAIVMVVLVFNLLEDFTPQSEFWKGFELGALMAAVLMILASSVTAIGQAMGQVVQDAPPPSTPASTHEHDMELMTNVITAIVDHRPRDNTRSGDDPPFNEDSS